ncbi:MAG TPA: 3-deoxy-D-manno-octulosonic acid transferase [Caulobacteraceae bacterium]|nr:3-deoxy-D-manno-octulosonic acid transferase [Caulobacteraceae bacterium]
MTTPGLRAYRLAAAALSPLLPRYLEGRARRGKEDPARLGERLGRAGVARPEGGLVWLHAVSVGEALSLLPLAERLRERRPDLAVLATTGTATAAAMLARRLPEGVIHQYAPLDAPAAVRRFLDHWRPDLGVFVESELWPNLILEARRRGVRLALVSARMTDRSAAGWRRARGAARRVLDAFELVLTQDDATAGRLERLGGRVDGRLNLKDAAGPLPVDAAELATLRAAFAGRTVVVGASTHPGEDEIIADALAALPAPRPLLVLIPRHPERGPAIAAMLAGRGLKAARRAEGALPAADLDAYVADTLGETGLFYRLADLVVLGGSLVAGIGGHNPLEPARLGAAIVSGRSVFNFADLFAEMEAAGAVAPTDAGALAATLARLVADAPERTRLGEAGRAFAEGRAAPFEAAWARLAAMLPQARP